jgi:hypothetical protein
MPGHLRAVDQKSSWDWLRFAAALPAKPEPVNNLSAGKLIYKGRCIAIGCALNNSSTNGGILTVYDGEDANGTNAGAYGFAASNSLKQTFGLLGVLHEIGVFLSPSAGSLTGALWVIPLWQYNVTPPGE